MGIFTKTRSNSQLYSTVPARIPCGKQKCAKYEVVQEVVTTIRVTESSKE